MANVMLVSYPELFAGGAIIGGLPYGTASGLSQAFERMRGQNGPSVSQMRSVLETAAPGSDSWPSISVWHGTHDQTVKPVNAEQIAHQWAGAHGVSDTPDLTESINGHSRKAWLDESGKEVIEVNLIKGMAHGVPLSFTAEAPLGNSGPFMLDAGFLRLRVSPGPGALPTTPMSKSRRAPSRPARSTSRPRQVLKP